MQRHPILAIQLTMSISNVTNFAYTQIGAGLDAWAALAKLVRVSTRSGMVAPPFTSDGTFINVSEATSYYMVIYF
jgi:hypothetical protein